MAPRRIVFVDFDGTACADDTGHLVAERYRNPVWDEFESRWERREISTRVRAEGQYSSAAVTPEGVDEALRTARLAPGFRRFRRFVAEAGGDLRLVSDGFDVLIHKVLEREALADLAFESNVLRMADGRLLPEFPFEDQGCGHCGFCKGAALRRVRAHYDQIVFVGNGLSDSCAAPQADLVFAKGSFAKYCRDRGIAHRPFEGFAEITAALEAEWGVSLRRGTA